MNTFLVRCCRAARAFAVLSIFLFGTGSALAETTDPGGGIGGTGITGFGVVQKFGSVFVNGREYFFDDNTRITRDGTSIGAKMLRLGDIVTMEGRIDPATGRSVAVRVDSESALRGTVEKVDATSGILTVLGQTVHVTSSTLSNGPKSPTLLAQIHRGEGVAVSGFARADGSWVATRIVPTAAGESHFALRGEVQHIDHEQGWLRVAGQKLIASPGELPAQLKVGNVVRVAGHYVKTGLRLESVSARPILGPAGRIVEMSGYIQAQPSAGQLVSNNVVLTYSDASTFIGGTAIDLRADVPIAVRGELQADGVVAVRAILIGVEPMRVTLPELEVRAPRESGNVRHVNHDAAGKSEHEKPETEQPDKEKRQIDRPDKPEMEKPEIEKPEIERPEIERPMIERPEIDIPSTD